MGIWEQVQEVASESNCKKRHVGCVITTADGAYISHGYNWHENGICDCYSEGGSTAIHSEIMAINNIPVYNRNDKLIAYINHKPCDRCTSILQSVCEHAEVCESSERFAQSPADIELEEALDETPKPELLEERASTHGDFKESSRFVQAVKAAMESTPRWAEMHSDQHESLHMIQHKVGRILYGDPNTVDHWVDIGGYAKLVEERLNGLH